MSYKKENVPCPVCDSTQYQVRYEPWIDVDDPVKLYGAASGIQGTQRLVSCNDCQMIYENPRYPEKVILKGYTESEEGAHDSQYPMRVESFYRTLKKVSPHLPKEGKILDIGTAGGGFLEAAQKLNYEAWGLEPSAYLVEQAAQRGLQVKQGTIESNPFPEQEFDMICLWDVIEHLTDPKKSLEHIKPLLKPNGILLINFPDIGTWMAKLAGKRFWWILSVHLHHFTESTLKKLCGLHGFECIYLKPYWQILEFGYLQKMAIHLKIPGGKPFHQLTPSALQKLAIPYSASQTTALFKLK